MKGVVGICLSKEKIMDDLSKLLQIYKDNYTRYRISGDKAAKDIADSTLKSVQELIAKQEALYQQGTTYIQNFIDSFQETDPDLIDLHKRSVTLQQKVPEVQTEFVQVQAMPTIIQLDYTPYLIKGGIAVGLFFVGVLASYF
jgi:light-regulated signal transduction histidine kinase (bacteriophytochrome)